MGHRHHLPTVRGVKHHCENMDGEEIFFSIKHVKRVCVCLCVFKRERETPVFV